MSCWQALTPPLPEHMLRAVEEEEQEEEKGGGDRQCREHQVTVKCNLSRQITQLAIYVDSYGLKNSFSRFIGFTSSSQTCSMPHSECRETNKLKQMDSGRAFDHHCCFTLMRVSVKIQGRALAQNGSNPTLLYSNVSMFNGSKIFRISRQSLGVMY